jgi:hypothetical protein
VLLVVAASVPLSCEVAVADCVCLPFTHAGARGSPFLDAAKTLNESTLLFQDTTVELQVQIQSQHLPGKAEQPSREPEALRVQMQSSYQALSGSHMSQQTGYRTLCPPECW